MEMSIASVRRKIEGWFILCDAIPGFREGMKGRAKQMAQFKSICDEVSDDNSFHS